MSRFASRARRHSDGRNGIDEQSFLVSVERANRPPVALDDAYEMQQGESLVIAGLAPATQPAPSVAEESAGARWANEAPTTVGQTAALGEPTAARAAAGYGRLPLAFEVNEGQTDPRVEFLSRGQGYTLFLTAEEAVLALSPPSNGSRRLGKSARSPNEAETVASRRAFGVGSNGALPNKADETAESQQGGLHDGSALPDESTDEPNAHILRLKLLGANPASQASGLEELPGKSNYFIGNDPSRWRTGVPTYRKVSFDQVYPGIDLVYYGNQRRLEYDFVVAPGADPGQIQLAVEGADQVAIDEAGNLVLSTPDGEIRQHRPVVYQEIDGERQVLDGRYVLLSEKTVGWARPTEDSDAVALLVGDAHPTDGSPAKLEPGVAYVGFKLAEYDREQPLVIDPVLEYATYLGGSGQDYGTGIAIDRDGNVYVTGNASSIDFPTTEGALQTAKPGGTRGENSMDAFVSKVSEARKGPGSITR